MNGVAENTAGIEQNTKKPRGRPFQPGVSGNPAGKPKGTKHFATILKEVFKTEKVKLADGREVTLDIAMSIAIAKKAWKGDVRAFEAITDRFDGKPHQSMEMEVTEPPQPIMPLKARTGKKIVRTDDSN
jgi:hypothetical protein